MQILRELPKFLPVSDNLGELDPLCGKHARRQIATEPVLWIQRIGLMQQFLRQRVLWILFFCLVSAHGVRVDGADTIEFLSGISIEGSVAKIDKANQRVYFETTIAGRKSTRQYSYSAIHAVQYRGKRYVLNEMPDDGGKGSVRTPAEVMRLIEQQGSRPPTWFATTRVDHPKSLDLSWPLKPPQKGWNNQRNMGQYLWDIINPNPGRWQSGIRLVAHLMELHDGNATLVQRDQRTLGSMYFRLFQDYPRAAYWLQKGNVRKGERPATMLAECYWRLGSRQLAMQWLSDNSASVGKIKLLGDMGETDRAVRMADALAKSSAMHQAFLAAGDALRLAKRYDEAIRYYERVVQSKPARNEQYDKRFKGRAQESIEAIRLFEQFDLANQRDGRYRASSVGYNGPIEVEVVVADQRIEDVRVTRHTEKQFYSAITDTTQQIIKAQDVREIDGTTSATITSQAIVNATAKALGGSPR